MFNLFNLTAISTEYDVLRPLVNFFNLTALADDLPSRTMRHKSLHMQETSKSRDELIKALWFLSVIFTMMLLIYLFMLMMFTFISGLRVSSTKAKELKRREEMITLREKEIDRQARMLQFEVDIQVCERLARILDQSALTAQDLANELQVEKELFASMAL
ncbi:hypothetical protein F5878DRAFT_638918 [Lentinula raphanica]|uniref:Uncharacterized protein n=1 Tax=Lentinula raphanica TaxID=153919 RepID=A0AA38PG46_9AGAR|nr:hypothetical protein F5880DRAFT_1503785 [Lentinula raphanica]KAJ3842317.1 hypothetical protein F5878DRAFT_638918 [Lentinula raphanica]